LSVAKLNTMFKIGGLPVPIKNVTYCNIFNIWYSRIKNEEEAVLRVRKIFFFAFRFQYIFFGFGFCRRIFWEKPFQSFLLMTY
jgi:hypothetical protein